MGAAVDVDSLSIEIGGNMVVEDVSFTIEPGTIWLVKGDCGTGKTTLAKTLVGLIPGLYGGYKVTGRVEVFGYRPVDALRRGMTAYIPQDVSLSATTTSAAEELAAYGLGRRIPELKRAVGDMAFKELRTLSAGERFKVLIGLSLLLNKKLLVIDEPSGYLDTSSLEEALDALREFVSRSGSIVILVEHRSDRYAGRVSGIVDLGSKTACSAGELEERSVGGAILEVSDLSFSYSGLKILEGVDLRVERGDVVAVTGPNGSGKTTLLKLALGLLKPEGGIVRRHYRRALYLPQASSYWMGSDLNSALKSMGCSPRVVTLAGVSGGSAAALSLGEARRLSVYVGIYGASDLVVVDEVSLGLDNASIVCLKEAFEKARRTGKSVVFSTHDEDMVELLEPDLVVELPWR